MMKMENQDLKDSGRKVFGYFFLFLKLWKCDNIFTRDIENTDKRTASANISNNQMDANIINMNLNMDTFDLDDKVWHGFALDEEEIWSKIRWRH